MFKNVAAKFVVFAFDTTTNAPKTGDAANITAYVSKDYGTVTVLGDTSATEMDATNAPGYYLFDAAQAETNADCLLVSGKSSTANVKVIGAPAVIYTRPTTGWLAPAIAGRTLVVDASGLADANMVKAGPTGSGTAQTARDLGGQLDAAVSTRLASASYTAPLDAAGTRSAVGLASANLDTQLAAIVGYIDTEVGAILAAVDTEVAAIKAKTDNLPASPAAVGSAMTLASGAIDSAAVAAAAANKIADHILRRALATALASSDGDTKTFRSLAGAVAKLVDRIVSSGGTLTIYEPDDSTSLGTQTLTTDAGAEPIIEANTV